MSRAARRGYRNPMRAGLLTVLALVFVSYYGFKKDNPFHRPFHISVVVQNAAGVKKGSLVRIAGVNVGAVRDVKRYHGAEAALVDMNLNSNGLPVHEGATVRIRPRLFLEGNFVLELSPGAPGSPVLKDGDTIPITHSSRAVQLDEVLATLQGPERKDLQTVIQKLGVAFTEVDQSDKDPLTKGQSAGQSLHDTIKAAGAAGTDIEQLAKALDGENPGDLAASIHSLAQVTQPLADNADELGELIDGLDKTVSVFADNATSVRESVSQLPETFQVAQTELPKINAALDPIDKVSKNVTKALDNVPALVKESGPFLDQTKSFLSADEGGALASSLEPISSGLASVAPNLETVLNDLDRISTCTTGVLVPTANQVITSDGAQNTGLSVYDEFLRGFVGITSSSQNYDGNGGYVRAATAQGTNFVSGTRQRVQTEGPKPATKFIGTANSQPLATRPAKPSNTFLQGNTSPYSFEHACTAAELPNLNSVPSGAADGTGK
ncbi:MAG: MlaD family protein [Solirubrobacteraceae bacterium]